MKKYLLIAVCCVAVTCFAASEKISSKKPESIPAQKKFETKPIDMKLIYVTPGSFQMGANDGFADEKPVHKVIINKGFWIGKYEVTQNEYQTVMGNNPSKFKGKSRPVEMLSWHDAVKFCQKLTKRERAAGRLAPDCEYCLPTESEWEFAARGGVKSKGYKFSGSNKADKVAWCNSKKSSDRTHDVGTKSANELGIHDMSGNVYEWCSDWYNKYSNIVTPNPAVAISGSDKVIRGGGWIIFAKYCRSTYRYKQKPDSRYNRLGFRVVKTISKNKK